MLTYFSIGATLAFAAAVQPGPFQAFLMSQTMRAGWKRTLPAAFAPVLTDGPIILVVLFVLRQLPQRFAPLMKIAGGAFLLYLAWGAFRTWRRLEHAQPSGAPSAQRTLADAAVVNLLNPNPYLTWSFVLGPLLLQGWSEAPSRGMALLAGFYLPLTLANAVLIAMFGMAKTVGTAFSRALVGLSAIALCGFAVWQLVSGISALAG